MVSISFLKKKYIKQENFGKKVSKARTKELKRLEDENRQLKELVAEKELMIRMLKELRKKP